jgi:hypothetical protein
MSISLKILTIIFFSIPLYSQTIASEGNIENLGVEISNTNISPITELLNNPSIYLGNNVAINGKIVDVCPMMGCWIEVKDSYSEEVIRVKVKDGDIIFPKESKNKEVLVEGVFSKLDFTEEQAILWKIHLAEEKGIQLSSEDITLDASDLVEYRIQGLGAKIIDLN